MNLSLVTEIWIADSSKLSKTANAWHKHFPKIEMEEGFQENSRTLGLTFITQSWSTGPHWVDKHPYETLKVVIGCLYHACCLNADKLLPKIRILELTSNMITGPKLIVGELEVPKEWQHWFSASWKLPPLLNDSRFEDRLSNPCPEIEVTLSSTWCSQYLNSKHSTAVRVFSNRKAHFQTCCHRFFS